MFDIALRSRVLFVEILARLLGLTQPKKEVLGRKKKKSSINLGKRELLRHTNLLYGLLEKVKIQRFLEKSSTIYFSYFIVYTYVVLKYYSL